MAALVPWDSEIFGFPVASYRTGAGEPPSLALRVQFRDWAAAHAVAVCSCAIPADDLRWKRLLPAADFQVVDFALRVTCNRLQASALPRTRVELRPAVPRDYPAIEAIAAGAFAHGRYHADPRFPANLANRRYVQWMRNALSSEAGRDRVFVAGEPGQVKAFYHVSLEGESADLRLAAIAPALQNTMTTLGFELYAAVLHLLGQSGIRRAYASVSAANTSVMNVFARLGFRFDRPELVYHWHALERLAVT
jgi:hypothetical protein